MSQPLSRNVAVLQVECQWKTGGCDPCSQTLTYETPATEGKASNSRDPSSNSNASFKIHQQEKSQPQCQQKQDLCGKAKEVLRKEPEIWL
jgi:hypothetical protein